MARKIGAVIALDGEQQFKNAVAACTKSLNNMKSALKLVETQTAGQKNSLEALQKKHTALNDVLAAAKVKQEAIGKEFEKSEQKYENIGKKLDEYRENLTKAQEKLESMRKSGEATDEELQKQEKAVADAADAVARAERSYESAGNSAEDWQRRLREAKTETTKAEQAVNENARAMEELEKATDGAGNEVDQFGDEAHDASKKTDELDISLKSMIKNAAINLAVDAMRAIGDKAQEAAKYVVDVGSNFEASMSKVKAISGASGTEMSRLSDKARQLGASTKFSATEVGDAMQYMGMAGWKAGEMLDGIDGILDLAAASGEDLATTSDIVTDALTAFGLKASDAGHFADIMAAASVNANTNVGMMGETFKYAAPVAGALGISAEDTAVAIGLMASAGIKASQAGTSLRTGLTNLVKPSKQAREAMEKYGIEIQKNDDGTVNFRDTMELLREKFGELETTEQAAAAAAIFGKNAQSGWLAVINASDEDFDKLTSSIDNCNGSAAEMSKTMQDNLQGKLTELSAATEGLGIAIYNNVAEPLSNAVEFATGVVSGLTKALSPAKTDLETFLDDVEQSNKNVETALKNAESTVSNAETKAAELSAYGTEFQNILTDCESFNAITLDDGRTAIANASGDIVGYISDVGTEATTVEGMFEDWADGGLNTAGIKFTSDEAQKMIGYVSDEADTVETRLSKFAENGIDTSGVESGKKAIVQVFDDMGEEVKTFETKVKKSGAVEIDTSGIEEGTDVMITCFDDSSKGVETFKGSIESLQNGQINLGQVTREFEKVEDSTRRTYHITDEFTKSKINTMIETLGTSVQGLAEAWNEQTGELTASKTELENWFDTAKEVAMYKALQDAMDDLYKTWGDATVAQVKAQSGLEAANKALDDFIASSGKSVEELDALGANIGSTGKAATQTGQQYNELRENVMAASAEVETSNANMTEAQEQLDTVGKKLEKTKESIKGNVDAQGQLEGQTNSTTESVGEAADALDGLADSEDDATDAVDEAVEALKNEQEAFRETQRISKESAQAVTDAFDEAKKSADSAFGIQAFGEWQKDVEKGMAAFNESMQNQIDGMLAYKDNLTVVKDNIGQISPEFIKYLEDMGGEGTMLVEELAEAFRNGDAQSAYDLVAKYEEALDIQNETTDILALDALALQAGLGQLGSTVAEWEDLGYAFDDAVAVIQEKGDQISEETTNAFWQAVENAKACGVAIPDGMADEIRNSDNPEQAIIEQTGNLNAAIQGQAEGLLQVAQSAGINVPAGIVSAIQNGEGDITTAYNALVALLGEKNVDFETVGTTAGETASTSTATGIANKEKDVTGAADDVVNAAKDSASKASEDFRIVGKTAMEAFKGGVGEQSLSVSNRIAAVLTIAKNNANTKINEEYKTIGTHAIDTIVEGMREAHTNFVSELDALNIDATNEMNTLQGTISTAISNIQTAISQAQFTFPNIQLPHVRWDWSTVTYGDGGWVQVPNFYVDWYAKAMEDGMILNNPTIFGMMNGKLLGGGEAGPEAVVGVDSLMSMIEEAVGNTVSYASASDATNQRLDQLIGVLGQYMPQILDATQSGKVWSPSGSFMGELARATSETMGNNVRRAR